MDLMTIASAAQKAGVSVDSIRNYCRMGLLDPMRDSAGRRLFTATDVERIKEIYAHNVARCPVAGETAE